MKKVFFMEGGMQMQLFLQDVFDSLDNGVKVNNLVLLNGAFHES
jgi:hypothetical protein